MTMPVYGRVEEDIDNLAVERMQSWTALSPRKEVGMLVPNIPHC